MDHATATALKKQSEKALHVYHELVERMATTEVPQEETLQICREAGKDHNHLFNDVTKAKRRIELQRLIDSFPEIDRKHRDLSDEIQSKSDALIQHQSNAKAEIQKLIDERHLLENKLVQITNAREELNSL